MKRSSLQRKGILGVGNALLDTLVRLPDEAALSGTGLAKGCMTLIDDDTGRRIVDRTAAYPRNEAMGGSAANTIRGVAALKTPCGFIGKVGDDPAGLRFRADLEGHGIKPRLLLDTRPTGRCLSLITPDGERTMGTCLGAAQELKSADIVPAMFRGFDFLHTEGYLVQNHEMIERCLGLAKEAGLCVSLDLSSSNVVAANLRFLRNLVNTYVDIVLANDEEAQAFTQCETPREALLVLASYSKIAVIKLGASGSLITYQNTRYLIPPHPAKRVDTTGAGDLYAAGFLYGMAHGLGLEICGRIATLLAAKAIESCGAAIPEAEWPALRRAVRRLAAN